MQHLLELQMRQRGHNPHHRYASSLGSAETSLSGKIVEVRLIGKDISISEIFGSETQENEGLTSSKDHLIEKIAAVETTLSPFAGSVEPNVWFGSDLLVSGITHYKWSFRRYADSKGNVIPESDRGPWYAMDKAVGRHYTRGHE